ncbi:MAG: PKD domain-containing protein [Flavobacteriales bacterium]
MNVSMLFRAGCLAVPFLFGDEQVAAQCNANAGPASVTICEGASQQLNGTANGGNAPYDFAWTPVTGLSDPAIANPIASPTVTTVYTLTVTDDDGVVCTDQITVNVTTAPPALLTSSGPEQITSFNNLTTFSICDPSGSWNFSFTDQSAAAPAGNRTIDWGDGSPVVNPAQGWSLNHTYAQGLWTMTYTIVYGNGCTRTQQYQVFLGTNPGGGISTDPNTNICTGGTLPFYINSVAANSPGTTYVIDFGDGNTITLAHPPPAVVNHTYNTSTCGLAGGQLNVMFTAQNPCDQTQGQIGPIRVSETPVAQFTQSADTACVNTTVTFSDQSVGLQAPACNTPPRNIWTITPAVGWTLVTGPMGTDNGNPANPGLWTDGTTNLGVQFNVAGTYTITDRTGNSCGVNSLDRTICVEEPPIPSFTLVPNIGCAPFAPLNTNTSVFGISCLLTHEWTVNGVASACGGPAWNFASGNASSLTPQFVFSQPGTYTVEYRAINTCNAPPVQTVVTVNAPPQVVVDPITGICAGQCVNPSAVVQNCGSAILTYAWNFPGGTPANSANASPGQVCFNNPGSPTVSLTVTNACGNATSNANLAVGTLPPLPVIASNSPVCAGQILSLSAAPIPGVTFTWTDPLGVVISNQPSVTISNVTAANAGVYSVVAVSNGCSGPAATVNVQVVAAPTVTVNPPSSAICDGQSTSLTAGGAGNYQWFIGATLVGNGPTITTSPATSTTYTVSGDLGGCPGSATVTVTVYPLPVVSAGAPQTFCDQAIPVNLVGVPAPGTWSGTNVTPAGVFTPVPGQLGTVTLTYSYTNGNGCTNTATTDITVQALSQIADAGPDTSFCQGNTPVQLIAAPPGGSWIGAGPGGWFTPSTVGNFNVTYNFGASTCATSDQAVVQVISATALQVPPDFTVCADGAPTALGGLPVGGTWSGTGVSGPPWSFDPGAASAGNNVLTYSFSNGSGCASSAQVNAMVNALPVVNAGPDLVLCDQPIPYALGGSPIGGTWSAGSMVVTPGGSFTPNGVGTDVFTYSYTDGNGCAGTDQINVDVQPVVNPAFAGNDTSVCVNSGALQLAGTPVGGSWSGPQVTPGGSLDTSIPGNYTLTYSFGAATCLLQDQITVQVNSLPVVDAGTDIAVCLDGGTQVLTADPAGGTWSGVGVDMAGVFDPLQAIPGGNPVTYTYIDPATGCGNSDDALVTVNPVPTASFTNGAIACANAPFAFTNTSIGASGAEWDFGDFGTSNAIDPSHSYASTGTFDVMLVASTGVGCTDTAYATVTVWDVPVADITLSADMGCGPLQVDFTNNSTGDGLGFDWDFGGLGTSTDQFPPAFSFPADPVDAITYDVSLTVTNVCGVDVALAPATVIPSPTAVFGPNVDVHCSYADVPFGNASYGLPDQFEWDFGDGTGSTDPGAIVTHAYVVDSLTDVTVTLIVSNACGSDTAQQIITILPNEVTAFFNTDPVSGCSPLTVDLTQFTTGDTAWFWDLGDGNTSLAHDLTYTYTDTGTYTIELFAYGCGFDSYSTQVTVFPSPEVDFTTTPGAVCVGEAFTFTNLTPGISGSQWDFGDLNGSTLTSPEYTYATSGNFIVSLTATSALNGCTATISHPVTVYTTPTASFTPDPGSGCIDLDVAFQNTSQNAGFYQWDFGDSNTSGLAEPFHTYTDDGTFTVTLIAENLNGCSDTTTAQVVAFPLPLASFSLSQNESCYSPVTIQTINASQGAISYDWDLGNSQTSVLNQPTITFDEPGTYTVQLVATNQYGCTSSHAVDFTVHPTPVAGFTVAPDPACVGYPVIFTNTSINAFAYGWLFGDATASQADGPLHTYASPGTYTVTLIATGVAGCADTLTVDPGVVVNPSPFADFTSDTLSSVANAIQFSNLSQGAQSYMWDFDDGETSDEIHPLHLFPADGGGYTVCLVAVNQFSCPDTICKFQPVRGDPVIFVPNTFTPNGDGRNEIFLPILNGFEGWNYRLLVFDRWGSVIHETRDRAEGWDGSVHGTQAQIDVYVWKVIVERDGDAQDFVGHVSLVR